MTKKVYIAALKSANHTFCIMKLTPCNRIQVKRPLLGLFILFSVVSCSRPHSASTKSDKIGQLLQCSIDTIGSNKKAAREYIDSALRLCKDSADIYRVYSVDVQYRISIFEFDTSFVRLNKLIRFLRQQPENEENKTELGSAYNSMGNYYSLKYMQLDSGICYYKKSYELIASGTEKSKLPDILINLGDCYSRTGNYIQSIRCFRQALQCGDSLGIAGKIRFPAYFGLGSAYFMGLRSFDLADDYFKLAEKELSTRPIDEQFTFCNNRGNFYFYKEDYAAALPWFRKAKALVEPRKIIFNLQLCNGNMGDIFLHLGQTDSAGIYLNESKQYFDSLHNTAVSNYLSNALMGLALLKKDVVSAEKYRKEYVEQDAIEPEFKLQRYKNLQKFAELNGNFREAYRLKTLETKLNDSLRPEWVNARIEEIDLRYKQDTALLHSKITIAEQTGKIKTLKITNLLWITFLLAAVAIAVLSVVSYRRRKEIQLRKHIQTVAKLRLQNIRNRISPHFIFNILNRQLHNNRNDELSSLVGLLRESLLMTESISIPLEDEIRFVKSYIDLESPSLGETFELTWNSANEVLPDCHVPAMILQIPIENALKHALKLKEGPKRLRVSVEKDSYNFILKVEDNGGGPNQATHTQTKGTGTGLRVLYQTIDLLNSGNKQPITLAITQNSDPVFSGTLVHISIPVHFNYHVI